MAYTGVEIFPPIGIARVGDSSESYFASEDPSREHVEGFKFRGQDGKIKRSVWPLARSCNIFAWLKFTVYFQAVKFHAYLFEDGKPIMEATKTTGYILDWTVNVANKKAAWVRFRGRAKSSVYPPFILPLNMNEYRQTSRRDISPSQSQRSALPC